MNNGKRRRGLRRTVQLLLVLGLSISMLLSFAYTVFAQYIRVTFPDDFGVSAGDFVVQSNGDIVVPGWYTLADGYHGSTLTFFHGDGSLNTSYASGGSVDVEPLDLYPGNTVPIALQSDDKIILAAPNSSDNNRHLVRYNFDGSQDASFDASVVLPIRVRTIAVQPDDKIIVAGYNDATPVYALGRYNADGSPDTTFGDDGWLTTSSDELRTIVSVALLSNGNIVAAGTVAGDFALAAYNPDGSLDTGFAENGVLATDFAGGFDFVSSLAVQPDDKIIVAGASEQGSTARDLAVARYNPDGTLDASFSDDGLLTTDFSSGDDYIESIAVQLDGKIVVAGQTNRPDVADIFNGDLALARYLPNGELDTSFGVGGKETFDFTDLSGIPACCNRDTALKVALGADATIVVLGRTEIPGGGKTSDVLFLIQGNSNQAPELAVNGVSLTIDEGQDAANSGVVSDSDGDTVTLTASVGSITNHDDGTWSWSYTPEDGPADSQTVSIVAEDGNGNTAEATFELIVHNVAPIVNAGPDRTIVVGETLDVNATFMDSGLFDTHTATIDFGSGDGPEVAPVVESSGLATVTGSRQYLIPGDYSIEVCVTDDDAGTGCDSLLLAVRPQAVSIDIKPGSDANCFNNDGHGVIPVAILSNSGFDATQVDPTTVSLDGQGVGIVGKGKTQAYPEDINMDGLDDLILQIEDADGTYEPGDTMATLTGTTFGGSQIMGTDSICIRP